MASARKGKGAKAPKAKGKRKPSSKPAHAKLPLKKTRDKPKKIPVKPVVKPAPVKAAKEAKVVPPPAPRIPAPPAVPITKPPAGVQVPKGAAAPMPPQVKYGAVDQQLLSMVTYGLFAAINKTFGTFGTSVVKNASLRILEYGYKRGWLPPKSKDPVKALNEFFARLQAMGYAEKIHVSKRGEEYVCEVVNLADWDSIADLRELHYPLLPVFTAEIIAAFLDQYFKLITAVSPPDLVPEKRGLVVRFTMHTKTEAALAPREVERPLLDIED